MSSIKATYMFPGAALLRLLPPRLPITELRFDVIREYCIASLEAGYAPQTVREKHLTLIRSLLYFADQRDDTPEVRRRLASRLKGRAIPPPVFTADEMRALWDGIRAYRSYRHFPARLSDLAILQLAGHGGIRCFEMSRIGAADFDRARSVLNIRDPKDASNPRVLPLTPLLWSACERLSKARVQGPLIVGGIRRIRLAAERWQRRLDEPRLTIRNLRRSLATALDAQGAPIAVIQAVLGHKRGSRQTLLYIESTHQQTRDELSRIEETDDD